MENAQLEKLLKSYLGVNAINGIIPVKGGCINETYKVLTNTDSFFIKMNVKNKFPQMFELEMKGLDALSAFFQLRTPRIMGKFSTDDYDVLALEWIDKYEFSSGSISALGEGLAAIHAQTSTHFGLQYNNYFGSLKQVNTKHEKWTDFFIQNRLLPLTEKAQANNLITPQTVNNLLKIATQISNLTPQFTPSLLHGDLWDGNCFADRHGTPCIFDPAIYYGCAEVDIAETKLFGSFNWAFYDAWQSNYHPEPDWETRVELWNIYPLLAHVLLFGDSYVPQLNEAISKYL